MPPDANVEQIHKEEGSGNVKGTKARKHVVSLEESGMVAADDEELCSKRWSSILGEMGWIGRRDALSGKEPMKSCYISRTFLNTPSTYLEILVLPDQQIAKTHFYFDNPASTELLLCRTISTGLTVSSKGKTRPKGGEFPNSCSWL